jgi:hypothetical protein
MEATVTKPREPDSKSGMGIFGWLMLLGMIILLIPLLPIVVLLKLYELITGENHPRGPYS